MPADYACEPSTIRALPRRPASRIPLRRRILYVALLLSAALGGLELFARWWSPLTYDQWRARFLRFEWPSDRFCKAVPGQYVFDGQVVTINGLGLRGPEPIIPKPPNVRRILVLGGSAVFNAWASDERTWPRALEEKLSAKLHQTVEVINGSTPGYCLYQSVNRWEDEFARFEPDLVIVDHLWNDLKTFAYSTHRDYLSVWKPPDPKTAALNPYRDRPLLDLLSRNIHLVSKIRLHRIWAAMQRGEIGAEGASPPSNVAAYQRWALEFYRQNLQRLTALTAERGIPLMIVDQPLLIRDGVVPQELIDGSPPLQRVRYLGLTCEAALEAIAAARRVSQECADACGATVIKTADTLPATKEYFRDHVHLTDRGIEALAATVAREVVVHWGRSFESASR